MGSGVVVVRYSSGMMYTKMRSHAPHLGKNYQTIAMLYH